jgi:Ribonuclease G/E
VSSFYLTLAAPVLPSCYRHDFAYRNYKNQSRFHHNTRKRIDKNFKKDLFQQCETERAEHRCKMTATIYYEAVRAFGNTQAVQDVKEVRLAVKALKALEEPKGKAGAQHP